MSYAMAHEVSSTRRRPRPGPGRDRATGYRVAPPVDEAYTPWVTILEPSDADGDLRWASGPDGVLLPVRGAGSDTTGTVRRAVLGRLAALARR